MSAATTARFLTLPSVVSAMEFVVHGPLRAATGGRRAEVDFESGTVAEALQAFVEAYPRSTDHLYDADDVLRPSVRVSRDGERLSPDDPCSDDETLTLVPAMRGG